MKVSFSPFLRALILVLLLAQAVQAVAVTSTPTPTPTPAPTGSLYVKINWLGAASAMPQAPLWRRVGSALWHNPNTMEMSIPPGQYTVEFLAVSGFLSPNVQTVSIGSGKLTAIEATYARAPGSIKVMISPPAAVQAGASWRRDGTVPWFRGNYYETGLQAGAYSLVFKSAPGWQAPSGKVNCTVEAGKQTVVYVTFAQQGNLRATLWPPEAIADGAQWRRVGSSNWLGNGITEYLLPGSYQVEFKPLYLWQKPAPATVTITAGRSQTIGAVYSPIESQIAWSTYLGGTYTDYGQAVALDASGGVYICGSTKSAGWVSGGVDTKLNDGLIAINDVFVARFSPTGQHLWSTYLGGVNDDYGNGIALDASGNIGVTGYTFSHAWVSGGYDTVFDGYLGQGDAFAAKLSPAGALLWSTYLGGVNEEQAFGIAATPGGEFCVAGHTNSYNWVSGGYDVGLGSETSYVPGTGPGSVDGFIVKLSGSGQHVWSTYLGDSQYDQARAVAVDLQGNVCVTGITKSTGWIRKGYDSTYNGSYDGFLVRLSPGGAELWSTYLGGVGDDYANGIAADKNGNICVTGYTLSGNWIYDGADTTYNGARDIFVAKFTPTGSQPWCTYLGGNNLDEGAGIACDHQGSVLVTGRTRSAGWINGPYDNTYNVNISGPVNDAYIYKLSAAGVPLWSTYLGGVDADNGRGIAVNAGGAIAVAGYSNTPGWTAGGYDTVHDGDYDGFIYVLYDRQSKDVD